MTHCIIPQWQGSSYTIPLNYISMGGLSYHCIISQWEGNHTNALYPNRRFIILFHWIVFSMERLSYIFFLTYIIILHHWLVSSMGRSSYFTIELYFQWKGYHIHYSLCLNHFYLSSLSNHHSTPLSGVSHQLNTCLYYSFLSSFIFFNLYSFRLSLVHGQLTLSYHLIVHSFIMIQETCIIWYIH